MLLVAFYIVLLLLELKAQEISEQVLESKLHTNTPRVILAKGKINFALENLNFTAQFEAKIVGEDSAVLSFYGPMNVLVGKAYSNRERFVYYDILNNWAVVGSPNAKNVFQAAQIPLSFVDFVRLFKAELLYPDDSLKSTALENGKLLLTYKSQSFVDFFLFDKNQRLIQYQKKNLEDKIVINITYPEFHSDENFTLPKKYLLLVEARKGYISVEIEKFSFDFDMSKPFSFQLPKTVEIFRYE